MNTLGVIFALTSAIVWGAGDFSGGLATRRSDPFQVLALAAPAGLVVLIIFAVLYHEPFPAGSGVVFSLLGGLAGAAGLAALYRGLAVGNAAVVAPTAGVLGAALPVVYAVFAHGAPAPLQFVGFALALGGIFLVSRGGRRRQRQAARLSSRPAGGNRVRGVFHLHCGGKPRSDLHAVDPGARRGVRDRSGDDRD